MVFSKKKLNDNMFCPTCLLVRCTPFHEGKSTGPNIISSVMSGLSTLITFFSRREMLFPLGIWENSIETCILSYVKQITSPGSRHETGCSGLVHWEDPEGRDGEGGGRGFRMGTHVHPWLIHVNVWQKPLQYCKVISLLLK